MLLISCSGKKVLFVNDPYFDHFASSSHKFYKFRKSLAFIKAGYRSNFINPEENEESFNSVQMALDSGKYDALVINYLSYHSLKIPDNLSVVLMGGSQEILYPLSNQVVSSNLFALRSVGEEVQKLWKEEGIIPLTIFWENPFNAEEERLALESSWSDENRHILKDNWLNLGLNSTNREKSLEDFFGNYDFDSGDYIIIAYCAPAFKEFLNTVPDDPEIPLILEIPENPVLPDNCYGIITEDYLSLVSAVVKTIKSDSTGEILKVENRFIKR